MPVVVEDLAPAAGGPAHDGVPRSARVRSPSRSIASAQHVRTARQLAAGRVLGGHAHELLEQRRHLVGSAVEPGLQLRRNHVGGACIVVRPHCGCGRRRWVGIRNSTGSCGVPLSWRSQCWARCPRRASWSSTPISATCSRPAARWRRTAIEPDQLEGRLLSEVTQGATYERLAGNYRAALAGERRRFEHRSADGTRVYDFDVAPVERDGEIVGGLAVLRDITERKRMERALAHSAREYRDLAEQASDVVARTDDAGRLHVRVAVVRAGLRPRSRGDGRQDGLRLHAPGRSRCASGAARRPRSRRRRGGGRAADEDPRRRLGVGRGALPRAARRRRALRRRAVGRARHLGPQDGRRAVPDGVRRRAGRHRAGGARRQLAARERRAVRDRRPLARAAPRA